MKELKIDEKLCNAIQARSIELSGLERIIAFALSESEYTIPQEKIDKLMAKHAEVNSEYELLKEEVTKIVRDQFGMDATWALDFASQIATIK